MENNYFKFENTEFDFPFYNKNPEISKFAWFVMVIAFILGYGIYITSPIFQIPLYLSLILFCAIPLIPILYYLNWDYGRIFRKPSLNDLGWALLMIFAYIIFTIVLSPIIQAGFPSERPVMAALNATDAILPLILQIMGEEIFKFIFFVLFLCIIFKYTENRKNSIIPAMIISLLIFGFGHFITTGTLITSLVIQGLGSVFHLFLYVKTKNLWVSYISHLLTDIILTLPLLLII